MREVPIGYYSMKVLKEPTDKEKGTIILSQVDNVVSKMPFVRDRFYIIERRGWRGMNESKYADIKLVEDLSFWEETAKKFPNAILLNIAGADFVDTDTFKPLDIEKEYAGIQISQWAEFKRHEMFIKAAGLLSKRKFLKLGHFMEGGSEEEIRFRDSMIKLAEEVEAKIDFPHEQAKSNKVLPGSKDEMNNYINKASIGILTSQVEGINRFKMECLSANIPVLIPEDACYPLKKHINPLTGAFFEPTPEGLARTIEEVLKNIHKYKPREYILQNTGKKRALDKLKAALKQLCLRDKVTYRFDDIDWDGRNQSLIWGEQVFEELRKYSNGDSERNLFKKMGLKVYIIRHGETDFNKTSREWGQDDQIPLNDWGVIQSKKLAERLKDIRFDKIFSSKLKRAVQTANELHDSTGAKILLDERLKEYEPGEIDPSSEKWMEKYNKMLKSGMSKYDIRPFGGDNIWDLIKRVSSFLQDIQKEEGIIGVVSHSGVNSAFINLSQGKEKNDFLKIKQDNTCINLLEFDGKKWHIKSINDSEHIANILPKKEIYRNQEEIKESARGYIADKLAEVAKKVYIGGDIITGEFGLYDCSYKRYNGSTVEIYAILKEDFEIPQEWKISMIAEGIKKYEIGKIEINGLKHKVNLTLINNSKDVEGLAVEEV